MEEPYTTRFAVWALSSLGLYVSHCKNWRRSKARTAGSAVDPGVRAYMERRELSMLDPTVSDDDSLFTEERG